MFATCITGKAFIVLILKGALKNPGETQSHGKPSWSVHSKNKQCQQKEPQKREAVFKYMKRCSISPHKEKFLMYHIGK